MLTRTEFVQFLREQGMSNMSISAMVAIWDSDRREIKPSRILSDEFILENAS